MKSLRHHRIEEEIPFRKGRTTTIVVQNPSLLRLFLDELLHPEDFEDGFRLYDGKEETDIDKQVYFLRDCFDPDIEEKKTLSFLQKDVPVHMSEEEQLQLQRIILSLSDFVKQLASDYPIPLEIDSETPLQTILKSFGIFPVLQGESFLETLVLKIRLISFVSRKTDFIFYNLQDYLSLEEMQSFMREMERLEIAFLCLSSHNPTYLLENEKRVIIDEDNYEYHID